MPVRTFISAGRVHDIEYGEKLIAGIDAEYLLADRGYDGDKLIESAKRNGTTTVTPPKTNRKSDVNTTNIRTDRVVWRKMHFCI
jgi:IS5 family transposase